VTLKKSAKFYNVSAVATSTTASALPSPCRTAARGPIRPTSIRANRRAWHAAGLLQL